MPKLSAAAAKVVDSAEAIHGGGEFEPLPEGKYIGRLSDVTVRDDLNKYGAAQWSAEFQDLVFLETDTPAPGRQWLNLTMPTGTKVPSNYEKTPDKWQKYQEMIQGRLKAFFEAFGYTVDSDTDEMINEYAIITVGTTTVQQGPKTGKLTNVVNDIEALPEDFDFEAHGIVPVGTVDPDEAF